MDLTYEKSEKEEEQLVKKDTKKKPGRGSVMLNGANSKKRNMQLLSSPRRKIGTKNSW